MAFLEELAKRSPKKGGAKDDDDEEESKESSYGGGGDSAAEDAMALMAEYMSEYRYPKMDSDSDENSAVKKLHAKRKKEICEAFAGALREIVKGKSE